MFSNLNEYFLSVEKTSLPAIFFNVNEDFANEYVSPDPETTIVLSLSDIVNCPSAMNGMKNNKRMMIFFMFIIL